MRGKRRWVILIIALVLIGGVALIRVNLTGLLSLQNSDCALTPATDQDFADAVAIGDGVFDSNLWTVETDEHSALISVAWFNYENEAIARSQYLLYNCGYTQADLDRFYGDEGFSLMLEGYDSWTQTAICEKDEITLREFTVTYSAREFLMRFWVTPVSATRVRDIHLAFPSEDRAMLEEYAARLFPDFTSCEAA
ncbi:MAG: hypothetical protein U0694_02600 [Anaerolineae bacterium]